MSSRSGAVAPSPPLSAWIARLTSMRGERGRRRRFATTMFHLPAVRSRHDLPSERNKNDVVKKSSNGLQPRIFSSPGQCVIKADSPSQTMTTKEID